MLERCVLTSIRDTGQICVKLKVKVNKSKDEQNLGVCMKLANLLCFRNWNEHYGVTKLANNCPNTEYLDFINLSIRIIYIINSSTGPAMDVRFINFLSSFVPYLKKTMKNGYACSLTTYLGYNRGVYCSINVLVTCHDHLSRNWCLPTQPN